MLSRAQARRIAIAATGLGQPRPAGKIDVRHLRKVVQQVGLIQLDSVNAVARAHELLFFSRVGPFDKQQLHSLIYDRRELYEGWLHVASLIPTELWPMLAWRRAEGFTHWKDWHVRNAEVIDDVRALLRDAGPLASSEVNHLGPSKGQWWTWSAGKTAIEWLFTTGEVGVATRRGAFERVYDLIERVMPAAVLAAPSLPEQ
ncbi:MAG TPA: crosslink repair DNA glycosylase YcaQ family protein, partial [Acidimicrobiales bacterium]|nr:crosslink repair DNA glycosylase YcaQ family protein [Acidimicrobiales bacterium]